MNPKTLNAFLLKSVKTNDLAQTEKILNLGANPNHTDVDGISVIEHAYSLNKLKQVVKLMNHGASYTFLQNVLNKACMDNDLNTVKFCIDQCKIDQNVINSNPTLLHRFCWEICDYTPLCFSIWNRMIELFLYLVEHPKTNINTITYSGESALSIACFRNDFFIVKKLLSLGASLKVYDIEGIGIFARTVIMSEHKCLELLIEYCDLEDINHQCKKGFTPIIYAIKIKNIVAIDLLLKKGANIRIRSKERKSAIDYARNNGLTNTLLKLLTK